VPVQQQYEQLMAMLTQALKNAGPQAAGAATHAAHNSSRLHAAAATLHEPKGLQHTPTAAAAAAPAQLQQVPGGGSVPQLGSDPAQADDTTPQMALVLQRVRQHLAQRQQAVAAAAAAANAAAAAAPAVTAAAQGQTLEPLSAKVQRLQQQLLLQRQQMARQQQMAYFSDNGGGIGQQQQQQQLEVPHAPVHHSTSSLTNSTTLAGLGLQFAASAGAAAGAAATAGGARPNEAAEAYPQQQQLQPQSQAQAQVQAAVQPEGPYSNHLDADLLALYAEFKSSRRLVSGGLSELLHNQSQLRFVGWCAHTELHLVWGPVCITCCWKNPCVEAAACAAAACRCLRQSS
jgi:hypothetical protein